MMGSGIIFYFIPCNQREEFLSNSSLHKPNTYKIGFTQNFCMNQCNYPEHIFEQYLLSIIVNNLVGFWSVITDLKYFLKCGISVTFEPFHTHGFFKWYCLTSMVRYCSCGSKKKGPHARFFSFGTILYLSGLQVSSV